MNIPDEAEKRWPEHEDSPQTFALRSVMRETFKQGAELAQSEALAALGESRQRYADLEARLVAAEAVIEKVRERLNQPVLPYGDKGFAEVPEHVFLRDAYGEDLPEELFAILDAALSTVLSDHDKEVAAHTLEDFADSKWGTVTVGRNQYDDELSIRERAATIRSGSEGETR